MSVAASDLRTYGAANMPEDDSSTVGGAIDLAVKVVFTDLAADDTLDFVSSNAGDTDQVYRVYGLETATLARIQEDFNLNGVSTVVGSKTFERVNKVTRLSGSALNGTVTVKEHSGATTVLTLEGAADAPAGTEITEVRKPFYNAASDPSSAKTLYEKCFFRNNHATETLIDAFLSLTDGPVKTSPTATTVNNTSTVGTSVLYTASTTGFTSGMSIVVGSGTARQEAAKISSVNAGVSLVLTDPLKYTHTLAQADAVAASRVTLDVEDPLDGTDTSTNRITAPTGYGYTFDCSDHAVANLQNLSAGSAQGFWLKLELDAAQAAFKDTVTLRMTGNTA